MQVTSSETLSILNIEHFTDVKFSAQGRDLLIVDNEQRVFIKDYYQFSPVLMDKNGHRLRPIDIAEQVAMALYVVWGEQAQVFNSQLPLDSINEKVGVILSKQGKSGFLTADNRVLRENDIFHLYENLVYYHNEKGQSEDQIIVEQLGQKGILRIIAGC